MLIAGSVSLAQQSRRVEVINEAVHETADGRRLWVLHGDRFDGVIECAEQGGDFVAFARACRLSPQELNLALLTHRQVEGDAPGAPEARGLRARIAARMGDFVKAEEDIAHLLEMLERCLQRLQSRRAIAP